MSLSALRGFAQNNQYIPSSGRRSVRPSVSTAPAGSEAMERYIDAERQARFGTRRRTGSGFSYTTGGQFKKDARANREIARLLAKTTANKSIADAQLGRDSLEAKTKDSEAERSNRLELKGIDRDISSDKNKIESDRINLEHEIASDKNRIETNKNVIEFDKLGFEVDRAKKLDKSASKQARLKALTDEYKTKYGDSSYSESDIKALEDSYASKLEKFNRFSKSAGELTDLTGKDNKLSQNMVFNEFFDKYGSPEAIDAAGVDELDYYERGYEPSMLRYALKSISPGFGADEPKVEMTKNRDKFNKFKSNYEKTLTSEAAKIKRAREAYQMMQSIYGANINAADEAAVRRNPIRK